MSFLQRQVATGNEPFDKDTGLLPISQTPWITQLPEELSQYIFGFLFPYNLLLAARVSKAWKLLVDSDKTWRAQSYSAWGWLADEFDLEYEKSHAQTPTWKAFYRNFTPRYLPKVSWFKPGATRASSEAALKAMPRGTFLVRPSSEAGQFVVSFSARGGKVNHCLLINLGPFRAVGFMDMEKLYPSVSALIQSNHHQFTKPLSKAIPWEEKAAQVAAQLWAFIDDPTRRRDLTLDELGVLHRCCKYRHLQLLKKALEAGASPNYRWKATKLTPMHYLAKFHSTFSPELITDFAKALLDSGADFCIENSAGSAPLHVLCNHNPTSPPLINFICSNLGQKAFIPRSMDGSYPIHLAVRNNLQDITRAFLEVFFFPLDVIQEKAPRQNVLHMACGLESDEFLRILLNYNPKDDVLNSLNPNQVDDNGNTPLHLAFGKKLSWAAQVGDKYPTTRRAPSHSMVETLLNHGADPNAKNNAGRTPLMLAVIRGHTSTVQLLLSRDVDVRAADECGKTALDHCKAGPTSQEVTSLIESVKTAAFYGYNNRFYDRIQGKVVEHFKQIREILEDLG